MSPFEIAVLWEDTDADNVSLSEDKFSQANSKGYQLLVHTHSWLQQQ